MQFASAVLPIALFTISVGSVSAQSQPASFSTPKEFPAGTEPTAGAIADFNHDGRPDVAVVSQSTGVVSILLNNGNGFEPPVHYQSCITQDEPEGGVCF